MKQKSIELGLSTFVLSKTKRRSGVYLVLFLIRFIKYPFDHTCRLLNKPLKIVKPIELMEKCKQEAMALTISSRQRPIKTNMEDSEAQLKLPA